MRKFISLIILFSLFATPLVHAHGNGFQRSRSSKMSNKFQLKQRKNTTQNKGFREKRKRQQKNSIHNKKITNQRKQGIKSLKRLLREDKKTLGNQEVQHQRIPRQALLETDCIDLSGSPWEIFLSFFSELTYDPAGLLQETALNALPFFKGSAQFTLRFAERLYEEPLLFVLFVTCLWGQILPLVEGKSLTIDELDFCVPLFRETPETAKVCCRVEDNPRVRCVLFDEDDGFVSEGTFDATVGDAHCGPQSYKVNKKGKVMRNKSVKCDTKPPFPVCDDLGNDPEDTEFSEIVQSMGPFCIRADSQYEINAKTGARLYAFLEELAKRFPSSILPQNTVIVGTGSEIPDAYYSTTGTSCDFIGSQGEMTMDGDFIIISCNLLSAGRGKLVSTVGHELEHKQQQRRIRQRSKCWRTGRVSYSYFNDYLEKETQMFERKNAEIEADIAGLLIQMGTIPKDKVCTFYKILYPQYHYLRSLKGRDRFNTRLASGDKYPPDSQRALVEQITLSKFFRLLEWFRSVWENTNDEL